MLFRKTSKELEWKILTEEVDELTGEDLPEKETLNEKLFEGDTSGADLIRKIYREANYIKFRFGADGIYGAKQMTVIIGLLFLLPLIGITFILFPIIKVEWFAYLMTLYGMAFCSTIIIFTWKSALGNYYIGYFFKRGNRTYTFYLPKGGKERGLIVYFSQKKIYQLQDGKFVNIAEKTKRGLMGNRLLFNYLYGYVTIKKKKNRTIIKSENSENYCTLTINADNKMEINTDMRWVSGSGNSVYIDEYNSGNDVLELPESFKVLCYEACVEPLEDEHLKYV